MLVPGFLQGMQKAGAKRREPPPYRLSPLPWLFCPAADEHSPESLSPVSPHILNSEVWLPSTKQPQVTLQRIHL